MLLLIEVKRLRGINVLMDMDASSDCGILGLSGLERQKLLTNVEFGWEEADWLHVNIRRLLIEVIFSAQLPTLFQDGCCKLCFSGRQKDDGFLLAAIDVADTFFDGKAEREDES